MAIGFLVGSDGPTKRLRSEHAVRLEFRIAGLVVFTIGLELPFLVCEPGQHAAFDGGEIAGDELMPGRRADDTALHVAGDGQRSAELANARSVAGEDGIDGGIEILGLRALQILRLIAAAAPPAGVGGMEAQASAQSVVGVDHGQQALELADGGAGAFAPELEHAANSFTGLMR